MTIKIILLMMLMASIAAVSQRGGATIAEPKNT